MCIRDSLKPGTPGKSLSDAKESMHVAWDVGRASDGSLKLIEGNPSPGTLVNPIVSQKLRRQVTGRWSPEVAGLAGLGVGKATSVAIKKGLKSRKALKAKETARRRAIAAGALGTGGLAAILASKGDVGARIKNYRS